MSNGYLRGDSPGSSSYKNWLPATLADFVRDSGGGASSEDRRLFFEALTAFENKDYTQALAKFSSLYKTNNQGNPALNHNLRLCKAKNKE